MLKSIETSRPKNSLFRCNSKENAVKNTVNVDKNGIVINGKWLKEYLLKGMEKSKKCP